MAVLRVSHQGAGKRVDLRRLDLCDPRGPDHGLDEPARRGGDPDQGGARGRRVRWYADQPAAGSIPRWPGTVPHQYGAGRRQLRLLAPPRTRGRGPLRRDLVMCGACVARSVPAPRMAHRYWTGRGSAVRSPGAMVASIEYGPFATGVAGSPSFLHSSLFIVLSRFRRRPVESVPASPCPAAAPNPRSGPSNPVAFARTPSRHAERQGQRSPPHAEETRSPDRSGYTAGGTGPIFGSAPLHVRARGVSGVPDSASELTARSLHARPRPPRDLRHG